MRPYSLMTCTILLWIAACSTTEWVNQNNPKANFGVDYNDCEMKAYEDPKAQGGMKLIIQKKVDQCLAKLGWRLREKRN